ACNQHRRHRRGVEIGGIGVPDAAEILGLVLQLDHRNDFRKSLDTLDERIFHDLAEAFGETEKFRRRQILIAEENHAVLKPGLADGGNDVVARFGREIDPQYFRADRAGYRSYLKSVSAHGPRSPPVIGGTTYNLP